MQKRLHLWLEIGDFKSLGALGALWELSGSSSQLRLSQINFPRIIVILDYEILCLDMLSQRRG